MIEHDNVPRDTLSILNDLFRSDTMEDTQTHFCEEKFKTINMIRSWYLQLKLSLYLDEWSFLCLSEWRISDKQVEIKTSSNRWKNMSNH